MPRSELVALVDIVLNKLGFREVMLLPQSLAMSFALGQSHCAFVYPHGLSFVDDFMLFDSYRLRLGGAAVAQDDGCPVDNVDFVEEFSRLRFLDESLRYACDSCELKEASEDRMRQHTEKEHKNDGFYFYTYGSSLSEEFENRLRYLFTTDKAQRVGGCVYFAYSKNQKEIKAFSARRAAAAPAAEGEQPDGKAQQSVQSLEDHTALAIKGASLFRQLDCSKECWLTDKEWQAFRLRSLKEKVLFFI
ncbi:hypothetical protein PAPHI01_1890 [Pancytospora philotis]|nr:hypothetical protein PAPHI01_1890 [Pancytospora philotis]